jgi:hypothetical protein
MLLSTRCLGGLLRTPFGRLSNGIEGFPNRCCKMNELLETG